MRPGEYAGLPHANNHQCPLFASRMFNSGLIPSAFYICSVPWLTSPLPLSPLSLLLTKKVAFVVKLSVTSAADTSMPALSGLFRGESFICTNTMPIPPPPSMASTTTTARCTSWPPISPSHSVPLQPSSDHP